MMCELGVNISGYSDPRTRERSKGQEQVKALKDKKTQSSS